jgi:FlaA1/EpsC-like NDP-sugar epimerase
MVIRNRYLVISDAVFLTIALYVSFVLRLEDFNLQGKFAHTALVFAVIAIPVQLAVFHLFGLYRRLWAYAGSRDLERIVSAGFVAGFICFVIGAVLLKAFGLVTARVPLSVLASDWILGIAVVAAPRWLLRERESGRRQSGLRRRPSEPGGHRTLLVGAGRAGEMVLRELRRNPQLGLDPIGFLDDDPRKQHLKLADVPVLGTLADLPAVVASHRVREIVIAMPRAPGRVLRPVVDLARETGVRTRTVPGLFELLAGRKQVTSLREVEITDLLRRAPVQIDLAAINELVDERTILITGAGGSIGSELCRQLAEAGPERLILLGHGENSIFQITNELLGRFADVALVPIICDIRDRDRLSRVFHRYRPSAVFHAAAHKHVPLMESNVAEAVTNNILGTRNVVECAAEVLAEHFVFISSDKAVRPGNIMGTTKRIAEQVVQEVGERTQRNYVSVRFGNVLGSRGSVVPIFLKQIREGGPITITHPEMRRYFMTIPEAVQLVLQAAGLGHGGEVYVLDMGEPVRIVDLAQDLVRLSGLEPGTDIEFRFTQPRPGERLTEELFFSSEHATPTRHPKVLFALSATRPAEAGKHIERLIIGAGAGLPDDELRRMMAALIADQVICPPTSLEPSEEASDALPAATKDEVAAIP